MSPLLTTASFPLSPPTALLLFVFPFLPLILSPLGSLSLLVAPLALFFSFSARSPLSFFLLLFPFFPFVFSSRLYRFAVLVLSMHSLTNSKVLSRLSLLVPSVILTCFFLTVRADLNVEWIDNDTIRVTGYGYGGEGTVVTNYLGSCTNCLAISSEEMHSIKTRIINKIDNDVLGILGSVSNAAIYCQSEIGSIISDANTFRRFSNSPASTPVGTTDRDAFTNYVYGVDNTQTSLDRANAPSGVLSVNVLARWLGYNNGIYDYANQVVLGDLNEVYSRVNDICYDVPVVADHVLTVRSIVDSITEENCDCSSGSGSCDSAGCPCGEQMQAILDYLNHIDDDQHKRYTQLTGISNHVSNVDTALDSYAKLVSRVLYSDSTITLADGETWTNVYLSGESEGYDYDKSNILQRIELILFGMAYVPTNTFSDLAYSYTNELDDASVENVTNRFNDFSTSISNGFDSAYEDFRVHVDSLKSIDSMFVFWGEAGSASPFTLGQVPDLGGSGEPQYITVGNDFLGSEVPRFRMLCRYAFQLLWSVLFLFMIWEFYVRLFKYVVVFLKYVCEWLNECFAS